MLDRLLSEHPEVDFVQLQINYADWENPAVQSRENYEVARKHGKQIVIMEPVKGGVLAKPIPEVEKLFRSCHPDMSCASWAIRFAASLDGVLAVLSGMSNVEQMKDNISYMKDFKPLSEKEMEAVQKVTRITKGLDLIPCTNCRYCIEENHCPMNIRIPDLFSCLNDKVSFGSDIEAKYAEYTDGFGKASECVKCGMCEAVCPQHLEIRDLLEKVAVAFE
jgi:predicted aldo/keto reductase-like oxidoreductase